MSIPTIFQGYEFFEDQWLRPQQNVNYGVYLFYDLGKKEKKKSNFMNLSFFKRNWNSSNIPL